MLTFLGKGADSALLWLEYATVALLGLLVCVVVAVAFHLAVVALGRHLQRSVVRPKYRRTVAM